MRWKTGLAIGLPLAVVMACGGNVSLGKIGSDVTPPDGDGGTTTTKTCSSPDGCGPALGAPAQVCPDGSLGGNTGRCLANADGTCGWELRQCPPGPTPACFDPSGSVDAAYKKCATANDCVVVVFQKDCCGSMHAAGVAATSKTVIEDCAAKRAAGFPQCECAQQPTTADDGSSQTTPSTTATATVLCVKSQCTTTFAPETCGTETCTAKQTCCSGMPLPAPKCIDGMTCPVSQRKHKKDIVYLSSFDEQRLSEEILHFPLATYRYKSESAEDREHLGFIIDDVAPSPAVMASGERVDMYGYQTMTVAALHVQAREIAELRRQIAELRTELAKNKR